MKTLSSQMLIVSSLLFVFTFFLAACTSAQDTDLDRKVKKFMNSKGGAWYDMNVPSTDGQLLYDIIVKNDYKSALEIGTSTGHSAIWIAWALSKTGGKLITLEIDESRHKEALANFEKAGLSEYIDARLGDAHVIVKELQGPFDFIFSDADKGWYTNYFKDVSPNLLPGGCFTAHNVWPLNSGRRRGGGSQAYLEYVTKLDDYTTTVDDSGNGLAISYKNK